jgi:hypothetical protein
MDGLAGGGDTCDIGRVSGWVPAWGSEWVLQCWWWDTSLQVLAGLSRLVVTLQKFKSLFKLTRKSLDIYATLYGMKFSEDECTSVYNQGRITPLIYLHKIQGYIQIGYKAVYILAKLNSYAKSAYKSSIRLLGSTRDCSASCLLASWSIS